MLKEKIQEDVKHALKSGDAQTRLVLSMLLAAVKNRELEKRGKLAKSGTAQDALEAQSMLSDEEVIEVLSSEIKRRKESIETYTQGGRPELADKEKGEVDVLMRYMPAQLSDDALLSEIDRVISEAKLQSQKDITLSAQAGKIIGQVMARVKGQADGQRVSALVKERLNS